ncbi:hypothetical protein M433DRAFT_158930 [Acidomyces richmondensis BFW]|nr:hypothetical protein M433DRAFT_158930 [Acidomyces richmondensis BFW]
MSAQSFKSVALQSRRREAHDSLDTISQTKRPLNLRIQSHHCPYPKGVNLLRKSKGCDNIQRSPVKQGLQLSR